MEGGGDNGSSGGSPGGFHNIDNLNLGTLLQTKQQGRARKRKLNVRKLIEKGFK